MKWGLKSTALTQKTSCDIVINTCFRLDSLFDSEAGSDVTFLVGPESETWRFPGHRAILSEANPVFRAMLQGPVANTGPIVAIPDVDGKAFDLLLRL